MHGGGIVRHLGLQNYTGPVPALAELISNAWDADAKEVYVKIPFDKSIEPEDVITIIDTGCGMDWNDCEEKYLVIGRNRRVAENRDKSKEGRPLMAHKGLGKLAGFGIASVVEVKTVKDNKLTHFKMYFSAIDALNQGEAYEPEMIADEKVVNMKDGTEVYLRDLYLQRAIPEEQFFRSMARRFAILSDKFKVHINGRLLKKEEVALQFRFPEKVQDDITEIVDDWGTTILPPKINWWIGFTEKPIKMEDVLHAWLNFNPHTLCSR